MSRRKAFLTLLMSLMLSGPADARAWRELRPDAPPVEAIFGIDDILVMVVIELLITAISMVLAPKPQTAQPPSASDWENPTAEAGRPIPVVFGTITIQSGNVLWYGEKSIQTAQVQI